MGRSRRAATPPPPQAAPPPVEDISAEYITPTLRQEQARRQARGAYATKGQTLGASGEVLGAGEVELAPISESMPKTDAGWNQGMDFKTFGQGRIGRFNKKTMSKYDYVMSPTGRQKASDVTFEKRLQDQGRKGRNARQLQDSYNKYLANLKKEQAARSQSATKGQII